MKHLITKILFISLCLLIFGCINKKEKENKENETIDLNNAGNPIITALPPYIELTPELREELSKQDLLTGLVYNKEDKYMLEELEKMATSDKVRCYSIKNDFFNNIIVEELFYFMNESTFEMLTEEWESYSKGFFEEGIEYIVLDKGTGKFDNKYAYRFMKSQIKSEKHNRYTYQYFFNFDTKTYGVTVNLLKNNIIIENLISIDVK